MILYKQGCVVKLRIRFYLQNGQIFSMNKQVETGQHFCLNYTLAMTRLLFENLPEEIILKVLSYLNIRNLICCGLLSMKIRRLSLDESLWQKIILFEQQNVTANFIIIAINRGCKYLSLHSTRLLGRVIQFENCLGKIKLAIH